MGFSILLLVHFFTKVNVSITLFFNQEQTHLYLFVWSHTLLYFYASGYNFLEKLYKPGIGVTLSPFL